MSSTLTEAVGTDTFGGLSGYKRDLQGNPTRVPSNLPAFRGRPNKPGAEIRAPPIKSSANHPDRKTNDHPVLAALAHGQCARAGSRKPGDVVFVSRSRPNAISGVPTTSGVAHFHFSRLAGIDQLNHMLSERFWKLRGADGRFKNILVDPGVAIDDWRAVPTLPIGRSTKGLC